MELADGTSQASQLHVNPPNLGSQSQEVDGLARDDCSLGGYDEHVGRIWWGVGKVG